MFNVQVSGLDKIQKDLAELQAAAKSLDGEIGSVNFNPSDPESVKKAISEMEKMIDKKIAPYRHNPVAANIAKTMKEKYREGILARVTEN